MKDNQRVQTDQNEIRFLTHQSQAGAIIGMERTKRMIELISSWFFFLSLSLSPSQAKVVNVFESYEQNTTLE